VTPNGKLALTSDNGGAGSSDGSVDTTSVIDLEANPPRTLSIGGGRRWSEGLAMSPKGDLAIAAIPARLQHEEGVLLSEERQPLV